MLGVFNAINGIAPANAGSFRRLRIHVRENCAVGIPRHPASCSVATCNLVDRVSNAVQRALAELAEGFGLAEVGYSTPASVGVFSGVDPRAGNVAFIDQLVLGWTGGPGGPVADGWLTMAGVGDAGVLQRDSVELDELRFPVRIETHKVIPDTEGPGWRRGAPPPRRRSPRPRRTSRSSISATARSTRPRERAVAGRARTRGRRSGRRAANCSKPACARVSYSIRVTRSCRAATAAAATATRSCGSPNASSPTSPRDT